MYCVSTQSFVVAIIGLTYSTVSAVYHDYCVIGAGPAGLQLGYFLQKEKRDYVIYEKSQHAGSFFEKYPRHRKLVSINKVYTGSTNKEYNLRHDWNSLLSDDDNMLFKQFSLEMFPSANVMTRYLQTFASYFRLNIEYNVEINDIQSVRAQNSTKEHKEQYFVMRDKNHQSLKCRVVVIATGLWKPNIPSIPGIELTEGYEDISTNDTKYQGKSVLILGRGNSAFETADDIYDRTNFVHLIGRRRIRMAWETHYVGDLRAVNNGILDTYQLKSLDGLLEYDISKYKIVQNDNKFFMKENNGAETPLLENYDNDPLLTPYDHIIRCLGFKFDDTIFKNQSYIQMNRGRIKKYPMIDYDFRSPTIDGLYFTGTITHSLDYRKSAGGFIHGFRYTTKALHRILGQRYHGDIWPHVVAPLYSIVETIVKRVNEASGIYQMYAVLCEVILVQRHSNTFQYFEEYPLNLLHKFREVTGFNITDHNVFVVTLQYGSTYHGPEEDVFREDRAATSARYAHLSNFLHPVIYYYETMPDEKDMLQRQPNDLLPRPKRLHHMVEDFNTDWSRPLTHVMPLRTFISGCLGTSLVKFSSNECFMYALFYSNLPLKCNHYISTCSPGI